MFFLLMLIIGVLFVYFKGVSNEKYWTKRGVRFHKKNKVMGLHWDFFTKDIPFFELLHDVYKEHPNEPAIGIGSLFTPTLYVRDLSNIQHVLSLDFNSFNHRGFEPNEDDLLANNILFLHGTKWKMIRQSMTPLFTPTKLKNMYYIMDKSSKDLVLYLTENPKLMKRDVFNTVSTFCSAAVGATVFGVTTESIFNSPFLYLARNAFRSELARNIKFTISNISAGLFKKLNMKLFGNFEKFFIEVIKNVISQRKRENVRGHDFADICVAIQKAGKLKDTETGMELDPSDEVLAAQAFFFFVAGVEPIATTIFATLIEIGKNPDIQERLHREIDEIFEKSNGEISYDAVVNMEYLDMVVSEAMRLYPPVSYLTRRCVKDTVLPAGNIKVDKGTNIMTPIFEFHRDPDYFPDPENFNPERFSQENRNTISDITYLPFGNGNRKCLGMTYSLLQVKSGLMHLLRNFSLKTNIFGGGIKYNKNLFLLKISNVDIELTPRQ